MKHGDHTLTSNTGTIVYLYDKMAGTSRSLLLSCARDYAHRIGMTQIDLTVEKTASGKPFFVNMPDVHFSISHSGDYWLCAFSGTTIGADIQILRPINAGLIIRGWYKIHEMELVKRFGLDMFFEIWCAKEACLKYRGSGFNWLRSNVDVGDEDGIRKEMDGARIEKLCLPIYGYAACICGGEGEITIRDYTIPKEKNEPILYFIK